MQKRTPTPEEKRAILAAYLAAPKGKRKDVAKKHNYHQSTIIAWARGGWKADQKRRAAGEFRLRSNRHTAAPVPPAHDYLTKPFKIEVAPTVSRYNVFDNADGSVTVSITLKTAAALNQLMQTLNDKHFERCDFLENRR